MHGNLPVDDEVISMSPHAYTLPFLINEYVRLFICRKYPSLNGLIRVCAFINLAKKTQPIHIISVYFNAAAS